VPYLTPQELPEDDDCRPLSIPANSEWLALFGGALTELTLKWNWEYSGGLTVDETLEKMNEIINNWYSVPCAACTIPGGYRVIRITADGHIEELNESGDWQPGTDDYYIPPPEAREGGEPQDRICLAAKNAVNVLNILYESLSDSWAEELSVDDAVLAFIAAIVAAVGFAFAPIIWAVVIPLIAFFELVYRLLEYLTADLWTTEFTDKLVCLFRDCASDDDGVVTFDFQCLQDGLNGLAITPHFDETQARLNVQLAYILQFIGGIDSLNLAGRTTAITDDDCDYCNPTWCMHFGEGDDWSPWSSTYWNNSGCDTPAVLTGDVWVANLAYQNSNCTGNVVRYVHLRYVFASPVVIFDASAGSPDSVSARQIYANGNGSVFDGTLIWNGTYIGGSIEVDSIDVLFFQNVNNTTGFSLGEIQLSGEGENPFGESNC